jgi:hypothetical protein
VRGAEDAAPCDAAAEGDAAVDASAEAAADAVAAGAEDAATDGDVVALLLVQALTTITAAPMIEASRKCCFTVRYSS